MTLRDGPSVVIAPMMPMYAPSFSLGATSRVIFIPIGISIPVPSACTIRPVRSTVKFGASAPMTLPMTSSAVVPTNSFLVGMLRYAKADTGTMTAAPSIYATASHCTVATPTPVSCMIGVNAIYRQ